jgi:hypothetical protein
MPILALPPEVLCEVFKHGAWCDARKKNTLASAVIASHVCRRWRDTALAACELWSCVDFLIVLGGPTNDLSQPAAYVARCHSGSLDISISIREEGDAGTTLSDLDEALSIVTPHSDRWRRLALDFGWTRSFALTRTAITLQSVHAPTLVSLRAIHIYTDSTYTAAPITLADAHALQYYWTYYTGRYATQSFKQLSSLTIGVDGTEPPLELRWLADLAFDSFRLTHLALFCPLTQSVEEAVAFSCLRSLRVSMHPSNASVASRIVAPNLEHLRIDAAMGHMRLEPIGSFFEPMQTRERSRRFPHLRTLHLRGVTMTADEMKRMFAVTSTLESFHVHESRLPRLGSRLAASPPVWSRLRRLAVGDEQIDRDDLLSIARTRAGTLEALETNLYAGDDTALYDSVPQRNDVRAMQKLVRMLPCPRCVANYWDEACSDSIWDGDPCDGIFPLPWHNLAGSTSLD